MDEKIQSRLELLRREFESGEQQLGELDKQRAQLMETMLRISGAIQVLEELVGESAPEAAAEPNGDASGEPAVPGAGVTPADAYSTSVPPA